MATQADEAAGAGPVAHVESGEIQVTPARVRGGPGGDFNGVVVEEKAGIDAGVELVVEEAEMWGGEGGEPGSADGSHAVEV